MNKFIKMGLIGIAITTIILLVVVFSTGVKAAVIAPFYMPWAVFLLIGITNRKK